MSAVVSENPDAARCSSYLVWSRASAATAPNMIRPPRHCSSARRERSFHSASESIQRGGECRHHVLRQAAAPAERLAEFGRSASISGATSPGRDRSGTLSRCAVFRARSHQRRTGPRRRSPTASLLDPPRQVRAPPGSAASSAGAWIVSNQAVAIRLSITPSDMLLSFSPSPAPRTPPEMKWLVQRQPRRG